MKPVYMYRKIVSNKSIDSPAIIDRFGRPLKIMRISVNHDCNFRCVFCHMEGEDPSVRGYLTSEEIGIVAEASSLLGVEKFKITGGEPTLRRDIVDIIREIKIRARPKDISMTTNGTMLSRLAYRLREAGLDRVNISLHSIDPEKFYMITQADMLNRAIEGLETALKAGFKQIKINMVVMKGINEDEVDAMVQFCIEHDFTLRFIETMPMGDTGRSATDYYIGLDVIKRRLEEKFDLVAGVMPGGGPAKYVQVVGTDVRIGFITPISQHFCESCNRVRLSADGILYLCLGQNDKVELGPLLRKGIDDEALRDVILHAIARKPERHFFNEKPEQVMRFMSMTGG